MKNLSKIILFTLLLGLIGCADPYPQDPPFIIVDKFPAKGASTGYYYIYVDANGYAEDFYEEKDLYKVGDCIKYPESQIFQVDQDTFKIKVMSKYIKIGYYVFPNNLKYE